MEPKRKALCFRIEDEEGNGVYRTGFGCDLNDLNIRSGFMVHPCPYQDGLLKYDWNKLVDNNTSIYYYFGFSDISQLKRWFFSEELNQKLDDAGIKICIYQTSDYFIGDTQMIFRKETAKLIGKANLV